MNQITQGFKDQDPEGAICHLIKNILELGYGGKDLLMDALIIGVQLGRLQVQPHKLINTVQELTQEIGKYSDLSDQGLINHLRKQNIYDIFLMDTFSDLKQLINQDLQEFFGKSQKHLQSDIQSQELIMQLMKEDEQFRQKQIQNDIDGSLLLAKQMQNEFEQEQFAQIQIQDESQNQVLKCTICLEHLDYDDMQPLSSCIHIYHRPCLNKYFSIQIQDRKFPLKCPDNGCKTEVSYQDLKETLDEIGLDTYNQNTFNQFIDQNSKEMSWCPTPDCNYAFLFEIGDFEFNCLKCQKRYCLSCRVEYHQGQSCNEYRVSNKFDKNDKLFMDFVQGKKYKQCPSCKFWVEKSEGCDHMTCRCQYQFCYICGGQYGNCQCKPGQLAPERPIHPRRNPFAALTNRVARYPIVVRTFKLPENLRIFKQE